MLMAGAQEENKTRTRDGQGGQRKPHTNVTSEQRSEDVSIQFIGQYGEKEFFDLSLEASL